MQTLPHLYTTVIDQHGAVRIDDHECARLIQEGRREGNTEFYGCESKSPLPEFVGVIEHIDGTAARIVISRRQKTVVHR